MNRRTVAVVGLAMSVVLAACGREEAAGSPPPAGSPATALDAPPPAEQLAADAAAAAQSCMQDCGNGVTTSIQCAAGESAVCDCTSEPKAKCEPQAVTP